MKSSLVLCVLLGVVISVRAASVPPSVEAVTATFPVPVTQNETTTVEWTTTTTYPPTHTVTGLYDTTTTVEWTTTTYPPTHTVTGLYGPVTTVEWTTTTTYPPTHTVTGLYDTTTTTEWATTSTTPFTTITSIPCCFTSPYPTTQTTEFTTTVAPHTLSQIMCPEGWTVFQGRCYYFESEMMTWPQALSNCAILESMLVSVHSAQEYGFLQQLTNNNGNQEAWLGGFYLPEQWLWIDGSWFYNNSWSSEAPDSSNPCLVLNTYAGWSNSQCYNSGLSSICVKNSKVPSGMVCPQGWTEFQGRCYYYNYNSLTWPDADAYCAGVQASLVSVHSPQEYSFLYQQTSGNPSWLGGFYLEDQWMWLDGSWFYPGFFTQMSADSSSPCLSTLNNEGWSNYDCDQTFPSFCVKNEVV